MSQKSRAVGIVLGVALAAGVPMAQADVSVDFVAPGHYRDIGGYGDGERNTRVLERHLKQQGERCLGEGQSLELKVFDVDLAGSEEWWHRGGYQLRVMRDISWPRIDLAYVWHDAAGHVLGQGRESVSDMNYLWRSAFVRNDGDALPYEKAMLRDWFRQRFCPGQRGPAAS